MTSSGIDIFEKVFPVDTARQAAENDGARQQHSEMAVGNAIARVEHMRKLHDQYIAAEQACKSSMDDSSLQVARDRIFAELSAAAFNAESAMSAPMAADDDIGAYAH